MGKGLLKNSNNNNKKPKHKQKKPKPSKFLNVPELVPQMPAGMEIAVGKGSAMAVWRRDGTVCSLPVALPLLMVEAEQSRGMQFQTELILQTFQKSMCRNDIILPAYRKNVITG